MKNSLMTRKNINVDKHNNIPVTSFKQEDDAVLKLALFANSVALDCTGQTIRLDVKRPDNKLVTIEGITIANKNEIDIKMTTNCFIASGLLECDLVLTDASGKMTTASFFITVGKKVTGSENVQGANVIGAIDACVKEYETWKDAVAEGKGAFINDKASATTTVYSSRKTQTEFDKVNSSLETIANKGTTVEVLERVTKEEIDRQVADGTIANLTIKDDSLSISKFDSNSKTLLGKLGIQKTVWTIGKRDNGGVEINDQYCILMNKIYFNIGDTIVINNTDNKKRFKVFYYNKDGNTYDVSNSLTSWQLTTWTCNVEGYYRIHISYFPTSTTVIDDNTKIELINAFKVNTTFYDDVDGKVLKNNTITKEKISTDVINGFMDRNSMFSQANIRGFGFGYGVSSTGDKARVKKNNNILLGDAYALTTNDTPSKKTAYGREFPVTKTTSYLSDICIVGDELWCFATGTDDKSEYSVVWRFKYDPVTNDFLEEPKFFWVDWGHINAINYNPITDSLIMGNGSADYNLSNKIYIISNVKVIKKSENGSIFKINECGIEIDCSDRSEFGKKLNVVWNNGSGCGYNYATTSEYNPNMAYAYSDDVNKIHILVLGYGTNKYKYGTYKEPTVNCIWNGTYNILYNYQIGNPDEVIGNPGSYDHCGQGADCLDGKFYIGLGHSEFWYTELSTQSKTTWSRKDTWIPQINHATGEWVKTTTRSLAITKDYTIIALNSHIYFIPR